MAQGKGLKLIEYAYAFMYLSQEAEHNQRDNRGVHYGLGPIFVFDNSKLCGTLDSDLCDGSVPFGALLRPSATSLDPALLQRG